LTSVSNTHPLASGHAEDSGTLSRRETTQGMNVEKAPCIFALPPLFVDYLPISHYFTPIDFQDSFCYLLTVKCGIDTERNGQRLSAWNTAKPINVKSIKITTEKQEEEMKRIITLGMAFVMMFLSLGGCLKATGDISKGERSDIQDRGERGGSQSQSGTGFGTK
jgi:hypothetical protein